MKLFVYGTLMRGMPFPMAAFLEQHAVFLGEGRLPGKLYDLGGYPGLVYLPKQETHFVTGHVFELADPERVLAILDAYEMIDPVFPENGEYQRMEVLVETASATVCCEVYLYRHFTDELAEIPNGDWPAWFQSHETGIDPAQFRNPAF